MFDQIFVDFFDQIIDRGRFHQGVAASMESSIKSSIIFFDQILDKSSMALEPGFNINLWPRISIPSMYLIVKNRYPKNQLYVGICIVR